MNARINNGKVELTVARDEFVELASEWNNEVDYEHQYDIEEINDAFPEEMIITEDVCDESEYGFIMWSEHFREIVKGLIG